MSKTIINAFKKLIIPKKYLHLILQPNINTIDFLVYD